MIHDDVVAAIVARATLSVPGVLEMSHRGISDSLNSLVRHDMLSRGVKVQEAESGQLLLDVYVVVQYGQRIAEIGREVGHKVNDALKDAVGQYPQHLTIHVEGVRSGGE